MGLLDILFWPFAACCKRDEVPDGQQPLLPVDQGDKQPSQLSASGGATPDKGPPPKKSAPNSHAIPTSTPSSMVDTPVPGSAAAAAQEGATTSVTSHALPRAVEFDDNVERVTYTPRTPEAPKAQAPGQGQGPASFAVDAGSEGGTPQTPGNDSNPPDTPGNDSNPPDTPAPGEAAAPASAPTAGASDAAHASVGAAEGAEGREREAGGDGREAAAEERKPEAGGEGKEAAAPNQAAAGNGVGGAAGEGGAKKPRNRNRNRGGKKKGKK